MDFMTTMLRIVSTGVDLTPRQLCVVLECNSGPQTVRQLAAQLNISKPAVSRAADRLENASFVMRVNDPKDRRSVLLQLTSSGRAFIDMLQSPVG